MWIAHHSIFHVKCEGGRFTVEEPRKVRGVRRRCLIFYGRWRWNRTWKWIQLSWITIQGQDRTGQDRTGQDRTATATATISQASGVILSFTNNAMDGWMDGFVESEKEGKWFRIIWSYDYTLCVSDRVTAASLTEWSHGFCFTQQESFSNLQYYQPVKWMIDINL